MNHSLNAKLLNEKLKQGWTSTDFATYLGIGADQFLDMLKKEFTRNAYEGFRNVLRRNEKHQKRLSKSAPQIAGTQAAETHEEIVEEILTKYHEEFTDEPTIKGDIDSNEEIYTDTEETMKETSTSDEHVSISELESKHQQAGDALNSLEIHHKELFSQRCEIRNEISAHQEEFKKMLEEISKRQQAIKNLQERFTCIGKEMEETTEQIRSVKLNIAQLTTQIEQAKKVYIYVCDSGEVDIDSKLEFEITNWELLCYGTIIKENELKSLTIIQAEALAKAITLVRFLIAQNIPYEVVFDSQISDNYFKKVIS